MPQINDCTVSVALVTRNRPDSLDRCLWSLRRQSMQPFEVIVSDDSDFDWVARTKEVALNYGASYLVGPKKGLYANRNFAAVQCKGSHVRTMDDDHLFPPDHWAQCQAAIRAAPEAIWTTGEHGFLRDKPLAIAETASQLGPAGVAQAIGNRDDNWAIADGSTIYPRTIFDRGFRMVEEFAFGSAYLEFGAFLYRRGWKSRCVPGAFVEHHILQLSRPDPKSQLFASICYNRYFQPDSLSLIRHLLPHVMSWGDLPGLYKLAHQRWTSTNYGSFHKTASSTNTRENA